MKKRTEESKKRTKFLLILLILTAILSITATYAWFSVQRDVEIYGFQVNVEVAENLQISLDGEVWTNSIAINDMKQLYGTAAKDQVHQAVADDNANYIPIELLPVSTAGTIATTGRVTFAQGTLSGKSLNSITACTDTDIAPGADVSTMETNNKNHPYLVFDMYLRNVSKAPADTLQLNTKSSVTADTTTVGLESSVRVGFLAYDDAVGLTANPAVVRDLGTGRTLAEDGVTTIEAQATTGKFAIWEPYYDNHTDYVVSNDSRVTATNNYKETYPLNTAAIPTTIADVTADTTNLDAASVADIYTNMPAYSATNQTISEVEYVAGETTAVTDLQTVDSVTGTEKYLTIAGNKISKVRVYLWLEGQDHDCVDLASTGLEVNATIKLTRAANNSTDGLPTYQRDDSSLNETQDPLTYTNSIT